MPSIFSTQLWEWRVFNCEEAIFSFFWTCETSPRAVEIWLVKNSEFVEQSISSIFSTHFDAGSYREEDSDVPEAMDR